jgi:hypothetical protein
MKDGIEMDGGSTGGVQVNKRGLADHYGVGVRTLENWMSWKIIHGRMVSGELIYETRECDRRLFDFSSKTNENQKGIKPMKTQNENTAFGDKTTLAGRYGVSKRTINEWMRAGLLIYIKVRHVVRFDLLACDESLKKYSMLN